MSRIKLAMMAKPWSPIHAARMNANRFKDSAALAIKSGVLLIVLTLFGCSESPTGGGIGGTGQPVEEGLIIGVVEGFGSIIINDQRFETDTSDIFVDGDADVLSTLRIGMTLAARIESNSASALELRYQPDVVGPIAGVDLNNRSMQLLGQTVRWNDQTMFDELDLSELATGLSVEVSGPRNGNQEIVATYIKKTVLQQTFYTVGRVQVDGNGPRIAGAILDVQGLAESTNLTLNEFINLFLVEGSLVRVAADLNEDTDANTFGRVGETDAIGGDDESLTTLTVTDVRQVAEPSYSAGDLVQILGIITPTTNPGTFLVGGVEVFVDDGTEITTASGMQIQFPDAPEDRPVLIEGVAQADKILINLIQFLDEL